MAKTRSPYPQRRAAACERLAESATSSETREIMHYLAVHWRALADEDEAKRKPPDNSQVRQDGCAHRRRQAADHQARSSFSCKRPVPPHCTEAL